MTNDMYRLHAAWPRSLRSWVFGETNPIKSWCQDNLDYSPKITDFIYRTPICDGPVFSLWFNTTEDKMKFTIVWGECFMAL